jgi:hypothetical protein
MHGHPNRDGGPHASATEYRLQLCRVGFNPIPIIGKKPPMPAWQKRIDTSEGDIAIWAKTYPGAKSTGILTRVTPAFDIDILDPDAAEAVEGLVRARYDDRGHIVTRIGKAPKRAIPFRCKLPFKKIVVSLTAPNGAADQKLEFLCDGQQMVVDGIHPDTGLPYHWHGGELGLVKYNDLPEIDAAEAEQLIDIAADLLCKDFGYVRAKAKKARKAKSGETGNGRDESPDWGDLIANIHAGRELHDSLLSLANKLLKSGMDAGAVVNFLRAQMDESAAKNADNLRWMARYADTPHLVEDAEQFLRGEPEPVAPCAIDETLEVFKKWLLLKDMTPVYAVLGAVAANYLDGDPVWLGVIGPPSSAKTEILNSTSRLPKVVQAATVTVAGLLSGVPKRHQDKGAKGGLLRQIGDFGIIALKDFGSVLSMHTETRAEVMAALREVFDGAWTRHIGSDGGRTLSWQGKVGLIFASTGVIDSYYGVIGAMGDRFLFARLAPVRVGQFERALDHVGPKSKQMRQELAEAVARLFAGRKAEPQPITKDEIEQINSTISLAVRLRGTVERERRNYEIVAVPGEEGTGRMGLALERQLAGLDTLGVARKTALDVVEKVALDSVPPLRRRAYEYLRDCAGKVATPVIANELALPTNTTRRILEDLAAYGLVIREKGGDGKPDLWIKRGWEDDT